MSVERIDHAAEARQIIETFHAPSPEGAQMITEAQVHATLALVEQQRITNLLSVYSATRLNPDGTRVATRPDLADAAFGIVLEALGLS